MAQRTISSATRTFTLSKYMNLESYRKTLHERCPGAKLYFSKFLREVDLAEIIGG